MIDTQKREVIFPINERERLKLFLSCELDSLTCYDDVTIEYMQDDKIEYVICENEGIVQFLYELRGCLNQALIETAELDKTLQEGLGYLWNVHCDKMSRTRVYKKRPGWLGMKYLLSTTIDTTSWIYKKNGNIFFEIAPLYRWHSRDPNLEEKAEYLTYKEFIRDYTAYTVVELSLSTVHEWLGQIRSLLALIEFNNEKYEVLDPELVKMGQAWADAQKKKEE